MFTGIVKETGKVEKIIKTSSLAKIGVSAKTIFKETATGDSICVNGVCLTVTGKNNSIIFFDAVRSTLEKTNLKKLKIKEIVNLEPALKLGEKFGGHFVLGHVDCESKLKRIIRKNNYWQLEIDLAQNFRKYIVENGSVTLDGVSLTVKKITPHSFTVDIIPFTYENTNLKYRRIGNWLNVEFDYLLKNQTKAKA
jgi:riboflavin synthase